MILRQIGKTLGVVLLSCGLARAATFTTFDAPGAGTAPGQGTFPLAINLEGKIAGYYVDSSGLEHGFVRGANGSFVTFDAPGAVQGTLAVAINVAGEVTGSSFDVNFIGHGFLRRDDGRFVSFDAPGAAEGTFPNDVGVDGTIIGYVLDANLMTHGFLRTPSGALATLDDPNAGIGAFLGTSAGAIDPEGSVVGCYDNFNGVSVTAFNFLRNRKGVFSTLIPPGGAPSGFPCESFAFSVLAISTVAINPVGVIAGTYFEPLAGNVFGGNYRGFLRVLEFESSGQRSTPKFITFDAVPSPSFPCCTWTFPVAINLGGEVVGYDNDFNGVDHAFLRNSRGEITLFDVPGATGTVATSVNLFDVITGYYGSASGAHGFVRTP
jgi:hypothetical protein